MSDGTDYAFVLVRDAATVRAGSFAISRPRPPLCFVSVSVVEHVVVLIVVHTDRSGRTRLIPARTASRKERQKYDDKSEPYMTPVGQPTGLHVNCLRNTTQSTFPMLSPSQKRPRGAARKQSSGAEDLTVTERRELLIELGAESLADSLLDLGTYSPEAEKLVERLVSTPEENRRLFLKRIAGLKRSTRYVDYNAAPDLAHKLTFLLEEIERGVTDPGVGLDLVRRFFETDASVFERCDDSMGTVGDVYRTYATRLFSVYAKACEDKSLIARIIIDMQHDNGYGARDCIVDTANTCLPENTMRDLIESLLDLANMESDEYRKSNFYIPAESLARQLKEPMLFKKIRKSFRGELSTSSCVDIAEVYLESGAADVAIQWLDRIGPDESFRQSERNSLYEAAYRANGDTDALVTLLRSRFQSAPGEKTLQDLLNELGENERSIVVREQVSRITESWTLGSSDAKFLLDVGETEAAAKYIVDRAEQLGANAYIITSDLADRFEAVECYLPASLLYRCLLNSILEQGKTKTYTYGANYLRKLDNIAQSIADWKNNPDHEAFKSDIVDRHGLKRSFWSKYGSKPTTRNDSR